VNPGQAIEALVRAHARPEGLAWLDAVTDLRVAFPAVSRQLGRGGVVTGDARFAAWRVDDAARALLLVRAGSLEMARDLYFAGDARERCGALRALPYLPDGDAALPCILDAMRTSAGDVFEAAILDNDYAARHLPQHEWRKAVLKAVFVGAALARIARLEARADAELAQSLYDYVLEREAATRSVPHDLWIVCAMFPPAGLVAKLVGYTTHPDPSHQGAARAALARTQDPRGLAFL
jgi:hypothetical protein